MSVLLNTQDSVKMGEWIRENMAMGNYFLALASGWPNGLDRFRRHIVKQQAAGAGLTTQQFTVQLMEFAHTGRLPEEERI